ncbi:hypothetical protein OPV22_003639 [Ensete ventricosum]|uniref:Uncharacterized protein n=1 Tax=Ensete ventricosum TaxID=4639 RepID=A0AAV8S1K0_ENSVE|nr:hypothetical protein OPV22_003639 [Ensete ventricosum]
MDGSDQRCPVSPSVPGLDPVCALMTSHSIPNPQTVAERRGAAGERASGATTAAGGESASGAARRVRG